MEKIRIVLADDHSLVLQGLETMLANEEYIEIAGTANNGEQVIEVCIKEKPDIVIMDISMPVKNGIEAAQILTRKLDKIKIILLSMHKEEKFVKYIKEPFISGYVLKDNTFEDLIYAVRSVYRGGKFVSPALAETIMAGSKEQKSLLTEREKDVLRLIVSGLSVKEIAESLIISVKTAETHKSRIMKKFNVTKSTELVQKALKENFI
jgi:DNA-binding NarL/FixJ family response regulator